MGNNKTKSIVDDTMTAIANQTIASVQQSSSVQSAYQQLQIDCSSNNVSIDYNKCLGIYLNDTTLSPSDRLSQALTYCATNSPYVCEIDKVNASSWISVSIQESEKASIKSSISDNMKDAIKQNVLQQNGLLAFGDDMETYIDSVTDATTKIFDEIMQSLTDLESISMSLDVEGGGSIDVVSIKSAQDAIIRTILQSDNLVSAVTDLSSQIIQEAEQKAGVPDFMGPLILSIACVLFVITAYALIRHVFGRSKN